MDGRSPASLTCSLDRGNDDLAEFRVSSRGKSVSVIRASRERKYGWPAALASGTSCQAAGKFDLSRRFPWKFRFQIDPRTELPPR